MTIAISDAHTELAEVARSFLQGQKARAAARDPCFSRKSEAVSASARCSSVIAIDMPPT